MTKSSKQAPQKSTKPKSDQTDDQSFRPVSIVFLVAGIAMMASEATRPVGIPFMILGATFFAISARDDSPGKDK